MAPTIFIKMKNLFLIVSLVCAGCTAKHVKVNVFPHRQIGEIELSYNDSAPIHAVYIEREWYFVSWNHGIASVGSRIPDDIVNKWYESGILNRKNYPADED